MTTNKGLNKPSVGSTGWNVPLNDNADILDRALGDFAVVTGTSGDVSLNATQVQSLCLKSEPDPAIFLSDVTYIIPSTVAGQWIVQNQSATSDYSLIVKNAASGTSVSIESGQTRLVYSDGTKVFFSNDQSAFTAQSLQVGAGFGTATASCVGTNATITFSGGYLIATGQTISVRGVTPDGYNGIWTVTASSAGSVTFVVPATLTAQTVAGSIYYGAIRGSTLNLSGRGYVSGVATQAEAVAGTNNSTLMTPLRTAQYLATSPTLSTSAVLSATADAALGAIGTYALAGSSLNSLTTGSTIAGSSLSWGGFTDMTGTDYVGLISNSTPALAGTWRLMAASWIVSDSNYGLFLRIS